VHASLKNVPPKFAENNSHRCNAPEDLQKKKNEDGTYLLPERAWKTILAFALAKSMRLQENRLWKLCRVQQAPYLLGLGPRGTRKTFEYERSPTNAQLLSAGSPASLCLSDNDPKSPGEAPVVFEVLQNPKWPDSASSGELNK
jgi:hypothetical protein